MSKKMTYDSAYAELTEILNTLQDENTGLDELSQLLKRAHKLSEFCKNELREIEEDVKKISPSE
jgi:exodeoxyribonuclease VII small subunit